MISINYQLHFSKSEERLRWVADDMALVPYTGGPVSNSFYDSGQWRRHSWHRHH